jgi:hypothetical protein
LAATRRPAPWCAGASSESCSALARRCDGFVMGSLVVLLHDAGTTR